MTSAHGAVQISPNKERLAITAAELFVTVTQEAIAARGRAHIALTGGSTPRALYQLLASPDYLPRIDWSQVELWFGDERTVPPDHPESNYGMAKQAMLDNLPITPAQVHRMEGEAQPPAVGAEQYEAALTSAFNLQPGALPRLDFVLLGLGADGHTASLFPGTAALDITDRLCVANVVPQLSTTRLTLTFPVLNNAAKVAFLVAGEEKATTVARILEPHTGDPQHADALPPPASRINPTSGQLLWLLDSDAAGLLQS